MGNTFLFNSLRYKEILSLARVESDKPSDLVALIAQLN